jgi:hypothetical protein
VCDLIAFELFGGRQSGRGHRVGLGGRLDATNVITPMATVITSLTRPPDLWEGRNRSSPKAVIKPDTGHRGTGGPGAVR